MKPRSLRGVLGVAGVVAIASVARADAPMDQYGLFDESNVVIYDSYTKLTWERYPTAVTYTFADAATHCQTLSLGAWSSGWRVPSYKELLTIVDDVPHPEYDNSTGTVVPKAIDSHAFYGTPVNALYWTSSNFAGGGTSSAYAVDFGTGSGQVSATRFLNYARCVHD
jgi:hypothetical protein